MIWATEKLAKTTFLYKTEWSQKLVPPADAAAWRFFEIFEKTNFFENWPKSDPGSILGRFGLEIRILREEL